MEKNEDIFFLYSLFFRVIWVYNKKKTFFDNSFMQQKNTPPAFTLAEILVVIVIISIIALWVSRFDFSRLSQKQKVSIETSKIGNVIEETRNSALLWRATGTGFQTPLAWKIDISRSGSGRMATAYLSGSTWFLFSRSWTASNPFAIMSIRCTKLDGTGTGTLTATGTGTLIFTWSLVSFSWPNCINSNFKILEIEHGNANFRETLRFYMLSGVTKIF